MNDLEKLAMQSYHEIQTKAGSNMWLQGLSAIIGGPVTMGVDIAVIGTHYVPMFNNIRYIFGHSTIDGSVIVPIIKNILSECLFDIAFDKVLGSIPVLGIYTNVMCAKTLTWRLGVLFAMLSSRGDSVYDDAVSDCMRMIRNIFPQNSAFKLEQPDLKTFKTLIMSVHNNSHQEFQYKISQALNAFK